MRTFTYTNPDGGSIEFGYGTYGITSLVGLGVPGEDVQEQYSPFQDGSTPIDLLLKPREIELQGVIAVGGDPADFNEHRRTLCETLNPKLGEGVGVFTNDEGSWRIKCTPIGPRFRNKNANDPGNQSFLITFYCHSPYWEDVAETEVSIDTISGAYAEITGDTDSPVKVIITGAGKGIELSEIYSGQKITYDDSINEPITITTDFGNKRVISDLSTVYSPKKTASLNKIISNKNDLVVAIGDNSTLIKSADGENWVTVTGFEVGSSYKDINNVCYNERYGYWFFVCDSGVFFYTKDFVNFEYVTITGTPQLTACCTYSNTTSERLYIGDALGVVHRYYIYYDSIGAQGTYDAGVGSKINHGESNLLVDNSGNLIDPFSEAYSNITSQALLCIKTLNDKIFVCGGAGSIWRFDSPSWTDIGILTTESITSISYRDSTLYVVGSSGFSYSSDFTTISWGIESTGLSDDFKWIENVSFEDFMLIAYDDGLYTFTDNITALEKTITSGSDITDFAKYFASSGYYVFSSSGTKAGIHFLDTLTDTLTTSIIKTTTSKVLGIDYSKKDETYIIILGDNTCYYTTNLTTFTQVFPSSATDWNYLYYIDNWDTWFILKDGGYYEKMKGITSWATVYTSAARDFYLMDYSAVLDQLLMFFLYSGSYYYHKSDSQRDILTDNETIGVTAKPRDVKYCEFLRLWIVACNSGKIVTSPDGDTWTTLTDFTADNFQQIVIDEKNKTVYICTEWNAATESVIYETKDLATFTIFRERDVYSFCKSDDAFFLCQRFIDIVYTEEENNLISGLSADSDMGFALKVGENRLKLSSDRGLVSATLTYRNRYIGV